MGRLWSHIKSAFGFKKTVETALEETVMYLAAVYTPKARIEPVGHQYGLFDAGTGDLLGTYSRARDAKRGARRKGLLVA